MIDPPVDVCVVGAGCAGIACAQSLAGQGYSVLLVERLHPLPPLLKAEKLDGEGAQALRRFGFAQAVADVMTPLPRAEIFFGEQGFGCAWSAVPTAGFRYHVLVNRLRADLDPRVQFRPGTKVTACTPGPDGVVLHTGDGAAIRCRLAVLATGDAHQLLEEAGAPEVTEPPHEAFIVAFDLDGRLTGRSGPVDSVTFHRPAAGSPVCFATFFRVGAGLRSNIFCPGPISAEWQADLRDAPLDTLARHNRRFAAVVQAGAWRLTSPVMIRKAHIRRYTPVALPGVVALGDAAHIFDPTGSGGLRCALLEAELLCQVHAPRWLAGGDLGVAAVGAFYADPRHQQALDRFFGAGRYMFALAQDGSLRGQARRALFLAAHLRARWQHGCAPALAPADAWPLPAPYLYEA